MSFCCTLFKDSLGLMDYIKTIWTGKYLCIVYMSIYCDFLLTLVYKQHCVCSPMQCKHSNIFAVYLVICAIEDNLIVVVITSD